MVHLEHRTKYSGSRGRNLRDLCGDELFISTPVNICREFLGAQLRIMHRGHFLMIIALIGRYVGAGEGETGRT